MTSSDIVRVFCELPDAIETAAAEGRFQLRSLNGQYVNFFEDGDQLVAKVKRSHAEYLHKIPGYRAEGLGAPARDAFSPEVHSWMEEGNRLMREREEGKQAAAPVASSGDSLATAMLQMIINNLGTEGVTALLGNALIPQVAQAAQAQAQAEAEAARVSEEKRPWRLTDLRGRIDPEDALVLLHGYADPGTDLGALSDAEVLQELARKANKHPVLEGRVKDLLAAAEADEDDQEE